MTTTVVQGEDTQVLGALRVACGALAVVGTVHLTQTLAVVFWVVLALPFLVAAVRLRTGRPSSLLGVFGVAVLFLALQGAFAVANGLRAEWYDDLVVLAGLPLAAVIAGLCALLVRRQGRS